MGFDDIRLRRCDLLRSPSDSPATRRSNSPWASARPEESSVSPPTARRTPAGAGLPVREHSSHDRDADAVVVHDRSRTIWAAPQPRAGRPLWSESGGRGGVSDLGGGEQPTAEACAASTSGPPSARTRNVVPCARRPRDARWNKSDEGPPRPHAPGVCLASLRTAWRCASLRLIAHRWPVLTNRGGRPAARGSRPPRATIARVRAGAPRRTRATAQARRASGQARP